MGVGVYEGGEQADVPTLKIEDDTMTRERDCEPGARENKRVAMPKSRVLAGVVFFEKNPVNQESC